MKTMKIIIFQCDKCSNIWNSIGEISNHMNKDRNKDNIKKGADAPHNSNSFVPAAASSQERSGRLSSRY